MILGVETKSPMTTILAPLLSVYLFLPMSASKRRLLLRPKIGRCGNFSFEKREMARGQNALVSPRALSAHSLSFDISVGSSSSVHLVIIYFRTK